MLSRLTLLIETVANKLVTGWLILFPFLFLRFCVSVDAHFNWFPVPTVLIVFGFLCSISLVIAGYCDPCDLLWLHVMKLMGVSEHLLFLFIVTIISAKCEWYSLELEYIMCVCVCMNENYHSVSETDKKGIWLQESSQTGENTTKESDLRWRKHWHGQ